MPLRAPILTEIAPKTWLLHEPGLGDAYVLAGTQRSLCIDTGTGMPHLAEVAGRLSFLPGDTVWLEPGSLNGEKLWEGTCFSLGGRDVRVIYTPVTGPDCVSLVDSRSGIVFCGGAVTTHLDLREHTVSTALVGLMNLYRCKREYRRIWASVPARTERLYFTSEAISRLEDEITVLRKILTPGYRHTMCANSEQTAYLQVGDVTVYYRLDRLYEPGEPAVPYPVGL